MESYKTARKLYRPIKTLESGSETTNQILSVARKAGCTPKMHGGKIRVYGKNETPVLQIRGASRETPSVFIHIHARTDEEKREFFSAINLPKQPERVWRQPKDWTPYKYVGERTKLVFRIEEALPVLLKRAESQTERAEVPTDAGVYHGKQAKTGNSLGLRFERALFHSHPEFNGEVEAHVIGPGRMLVVARTEAETRSKEEDPVLSSFMSFLAADMQRSPERITPLDAALTKRARALVSDVESSAEEDLGDEALL